MMDFVKPLVEAYNEENLEKKAERCYRMCYKSEAHIKEGSEQFLTGLIHNDHKNKHLSPLEHCRVVITMPDRMASAVHVYQSLSNTAFFDISIGEKVYQYTVTGNFRAWMEFLTSNLKMNRWTESQVQDAKLHIGRLLAMTYPVIFKSDCGDVPFLFPLSVCEAEDYQTFRIVTTRDILQELARHRSLSFSVESTRYCNYNKKGMTFTLPEPYEWSKDVELNHDVKQHVDNLCESISPIGNKDMVVGLRRDKLNVFEMIANTECMSDLYMECATIAEALYNRALVIGAKPQEARMLLPGALKTELMITGTFKAWKHFIDLRDDAAAHPQIRIIAEMIHKSLDTNHPGWDNVNHN